MEMFYVLSLLSNVQKDFYLIFLVFSEYLLRKKEEEKPIGTKNILLTVV